jgi:Coenzyme PQQ synthesis protein D (PqqD)
MFQSRSNSNSKLKRASNAKTTVLPDGYVALFCAPSKNAFTLPPVGALAWEFFDGGLSAQEVATEVAKALGTEETADLRKQILKLSSELERNGFLEKCD